MIKKKLKKWYPTKEKENNAAFLEKIYEVSNHIHNMTLTTNPHNWVVCGEDVANQLNRLYPNWSTQESVNYTNQWCGTTYVNICSGTTTYTQPIYSATTSFFRDDD